MKFIQVSIWFLYTLTCSSQIYEIPNADEQPDWVFPLWFEDDTGAKDTIYIAYDEDAVDFGIPSSDVVFGEKFQSINTDTFNVIWDDVIGGEAYKVVVFENITTPVVMSFIRARLPLKIAWDNNLFYSEILPFPDNSPVPNAWGLIHCTYTGFEGCQIIEEDAIVITDTPDYDIWGSFVSDSIVFDSDEFEYFANFLEFEILEYGYAHDWMTTENEQSNKSDISPNPTAEYIKLNLDSYVGGDVFIIDISGLPIKKYLNISSDIIDTRELPVGLYSMIFIKDDIQLSRKFVKI